MIRIKRYALSLSVSSTPPGPIDNRYWPRARTSFLNQFQPIAQRYRRRRRKGFYFFTFFMMLGFALTYINVREILRFYGFVVLVTTWILVVMLLVFGLRLRCPACRKRLEPAKGSYCPQCGSDQFHGDAHQGILNSRDRFCPSCNCPIAEADADGGRNYRIRGCTHCGVMLDEVGV